MKRLTLSRDGSRLALAIPDTAPLRAAAHAVRGARFEGSSEGFAVFTYAPLPEAWAELRDTFSPELDERAAPVVKRLEQQDAALAAALAAKGAGEPLAFDPQLRTTPMAHQCAAMNFAWRLLQAGQGGAGLLMEQGTGKSLVSIGLANGLAAAGKIGWVLVVAPNSLKGTWGAADGEIRKHSDLEFASEPHVEVLRGTKAQRLQQLRRAFDTDHNPSLLWIVTNYDQFSEDPRKSDHLREVLAIIREASKVAPGLLVCDESTALKNPRAKRTKSLHELARAFPFHLILTGTPITKSPLDAWAQFEVIAPGCLGFPSFLSFERRYAVMQRQHLGGRQFMSVVGFQNLPDLEQRVARISYRVRAADCLDLPPVVVQRIPVELSPEQRRLLQQLREDMMAELDGAGLDGRNVLTRYLRMAEVAGGYPHVLGPNGQPAGVRALDPNPKLDAADEFLSLFLDDPSHKVVAFAQFRAEVDALSALGRKNGWHPVTFHGGVSEADRDAGRQRFSEDPACRLFVAQYQTGSKGLTLVSANAVLFYSLTFSLEDYLQARKRVHRIGQQRTVTEAYLLAVDAGPRGGTRRTLDQLQLAALENKRTLADAVTGDAARELLGAM
jgi:SNF2 family DNA or RNA helicase